VELFEPLSLAHQLFMNATSIFCTSKLHKNTVKEKYHGELDLSEALIKPFTRLGNFFPSQYATDEKFVRDNFCKTRVCLHILAQVAFITYVKPASIRK